MVSPRVHARARLLKVVPFPLPASHPSLRRDGTDLGSGTGPIPEHHSTAVTKRKSQLTCIVKEVGFKGMHETNLLLSQDRETGQTQCHNLERNVSTSSSPTGWRGYTVRHACNSSNVGRIVCDLPTHLRNVHSSMLSLIRQCFFRHHGRFDGQPPTSLDLMAPPLRLRRRFLANAIMAAPT